MIDPARTAALRFAQASVPQGQLTAGLEGTAAGTGGSSFADTLKNALEEVSAVQDNSQEVVQAFLRGEPVELHEVMAVTEEAGIALEMLIELRNKFTDAYRTIINMQA